MSDVNHQIIKLIGCRSLYLRRKEILEALGVRRREKLPKVPHDARELLEQFELYSSGDSSVNLIVRPWCNSSDYWGLRCDLHRKIKEDLEGAGCSIPYPQRDVHVIATNGSGATVA